MSFWVNFSSIVEKFSTSNDRKKFFLQKLNFTYDDIEEFEKTDFKRALLRGRHTKEFLNWLNNKKQANK